MLIRPNRLKTSSGGDYLAVQVANILRTYGTDAHVYLPGIGVINGLTAGNYLDSAGTTAATVDNPVGLVLDAANGQLSAELISNGAFATDTAWTKGAGWTISGGAARIASSSTTNSIREFVATAGSTYKVTYTITSVSAQGFRVYAGGNFGVSNTTAGTYTEYITCGSTDTSIGISCLAAGTTGVIDDFSAKEVLGIHALQATTANKPILHSAGGRYYWSFDSTDVLTATFPAGYESATIINTAETGQVTYTGQNIVGTYGLTGATIGNELVTNGAFATDTIWTKGTGWTISSGVANFSNATGTSLTQTIPSVASGKLVKLEFYLTMTSGAGLTVGLNVGGGIDNFGTFNTTGLKTAYVTTTVARAGLALTGIGGSVFSIDNISVKEATLKEYARFIFRTGLTASELATMQTFANRLAGV